MMRARVSLVCLAALSATLWSSDALGQDLLFGSSPNPVGSGARALGIASAFIATADDATAASWNPAGLIVLEDPELSLVMDLKNRREWLKGLGIADGDRTQSVVYPGINYFSAAYPFKLDGRYFVASLNFQATIDYEKKQRGSILFAQQGNVARMEYDLRQSGRMRALTPALAFQISPDIALGVALEISTAKLGYENGWTQEVSMVTSTTAANGAAQTAESESSEQYSFDGFGANVGLLWDATPRITVGAVLKTPRWGKTQREISASVQTYASDGTPLADVTDTRSHDEATWWPLSYGVGVAYRHSDALTASVDLYRTEWSLFRQRQTRADGSHQYINPISGERYKDAAVGGITQLHVGGEYLFILPRTVVPVRGGFFYDPEPHAEGLNHFFGFAVGTGVSIGEVIVDAAYQLRWGPNANPNVISIPEESEGTYVGSLRGGVLQHQFYLSAILHLPRFL
jgi:long-subunit fatty acid transport protein